MRKEIEKVVDVLCDLFQVMYKSMDTCGQEDGSRNTFHRIIIEVTEMNLWNLQYQVSHGNEFFRMILLINDSIRCLVKCHPDQSRSYFPCRCKSDQSISPCNSFFNGIK